MKNIIMRCAAVLGLLFCTGVLAFGQSAEQSGLGKVLVLYYSYSENANTEKVAEITQGLTNADIVKVEPAAPFPEMEYRQFTQWAKDRQQQEAYPPIRDLNVDIASYDFIFVGTPVWWGLPSLPITTLLRQTDFGGKPLAAFSTAQGGPGTAVSDIGKQAKNALAKSGVNFNNVASDSQINEKVTTWVRSLQR
ncbi:MAG: NAD(P)H-dependent oxidoreductase [Synergistaceae bacterium]|jgi:flavodoxin|nr:NAD(P)H-dependent oxidoreductase [Synergistaceae bacterium]